MKTATRIFVMVVVATMAWSAIGEAQGIAGERGGKRCGPAGVWIGANETYGLEYLVTIQQMAGHCFSVVSDGIEITPPWETSTPWRGMLSKIDSRSFLVELVTFADPSQLSDPDAEVPDIAAIRGRLTMLDCDHFEIDFGETGVYAWGQTPFEDEPLATWPPSIAHYARVPFDCENRSVNQ